MKILMIACSKNAFSLMQDVKKNWIEKEPDTDIICKVKCKSLPEFSMKQSVSRCVEEWFDRVDAIVFFAAAGIAVRSIAPCLKHKSADPAVVVVDETGKFSISLLSGHMGGANELAEKIAGMSGAVPVITTATDREGKFAVDDYARKHNLAVTDWKLAKEISVAVLEGEQIGLSVDELCQGIEEKDPAGDGLTGQEKGIYISYRQTFPQQFPVTLQLVPKIFVVGIGCRKDTAKEKIAQAIGQCLAEENIRPEAVYAVASIGIKSREKGILAYCEKMNLPFVTYSARELQGVEGDYSESAFVEQVTGVSNVCERSAVAAAKGQLVCKKKIYDGVTVAIAKREGYDSRKREISIQL